MNEAFWGDVLANVVGGIVAGLLILWVAEMTFGLRRERQRRKAEREAEIRRASKYVQLVKKEIASIVKQIPRMRDSHNDAGVECG